MSDVMMFMGGGGMTPAIAGAYLWFVSYDVDQVGSTIAGADGAVELKCMQYRDLLEAWRTN